MEVLRELMGSLLKPEMILANVIIPILLAIFKAGINFFANNTLVSKFEDKRTNRYMYIWVLKFWKTTVLPLGFCLCILDMALTFCGEVGVKDNLQAIVLVVFSFIGLWGLLFVFNKKKLRVMLKTVITIVVCSMMLLFLCRQFSSNGWDSWFLIVCSCFQIVCLELHLLENGYYDEQSNTIFQIMECVISIVEICFISTIEELWLVMVLFLIAIVVVSFDVWIWIDKTEPQIEKQVIVRISENKLKEYVTCGAIKKTRFGDLYFRDEENCEVFVSKDAVKQIQFDYNLKLQLQRKIEEFKILDDPMTTLSQDWYVKSVTNDWLNISSWDGKVTKNIIYPKKNVIWTTRSCFLLH